MSGMVLNREYSTNLPSSENLNMFHPILSEFRRLLFCFDLAESNPVFPLVREGLNQKQAYMAYKSRLNIKLKFIE